MLRRLAILALASGCMHMGPHTNEAVAQDGRKLAWRAPIASATFCATCGRGAPTLITFGAPGKITVIINSCYAHAHQKIGDHDALSIVRAEDQGAADAGQLDIADCTSTHVTGTLWATFSDGRRIDAIIDTPLSAP
jgi:hypothetical protein